MKEKKSLIKNPSFQTILTSLLCIVLGLLIGYVVALAAGMVDFAGVASASWFQLPKFMHFGVEFRPDACIALGLLFVINSIQAIGDYTSTTIGGMNREPSNAELQGGIISYGVTNILFSLFGCLPTATYSQNVGIVITNKVINRMVFALTALLYGSMQERLASGPKAKAAPVLSALGLYLAAQCFAGMLL
jgi:xanthine/uracil permease